jgi:hypothetical protein
MFNIVTLSAPRQVVKAIYKETFYLIKLVTRGDPGITGSPPSAFSGRPAARPDMTEVTATGARSGRYAVAEF